MIFIKTSIKINFCYFFSAGINAIAFENADGSVPNAFSNNTFSSLLVSPNIDLVGFGTAVGFSLPVSKDDSSPSSSYQSGLT